MQKELHAHPLTPSIPRVLARVLWKQFLVITLIACIAESLVGLSFLLMGSTIDNLIYGLQEPGQHSLTQGLVLAGAYSLAILTINLLRQNYELNNSLLFVEIRSALSSLVYGKIFTLNSKSLSQ